MKYFTKLSLRLLQIALLLVVLSNSYLFSQWDVLIENTDRFSVYFANENTGWAAGAKGTIRKTTDGGNSWSIHSSGTTYDLFGVQFVDVNTGWVVGYNGTICKTTDGGTSWVSQTSGTTNNLRGVHFLNENTGWITGWSGTILKTTDGGTSWVSQISGTTNSFYGINFADENNGWVVGNSGTIFKTTDGGTSWVSQISGSPFTLNSVFFTDINTGWIVGNGGTILKTTDGGATWIGQTSGTTNILNCIRFTDANTGWTVGNSGTVLKTIDGGATWISSLWSGSGNHLYSVFFVDVNNGFAVGKYGVIVNTNTGGTYWSIQLNGSDYALKSVHFVDINTGWAVGNYGTILKTTDGGLTWAFQGSGTANNLNSVYFADANTGWAVGNSGTILHTFNGGSSWLSQSSGFTSTLNGVYFIDSDNGYTVGSSGRILKTNNGGSSWSSQTSGTTYGINGVFFANANTGWVIVTNGSIRKTTDSGENWFGQTSGTANQSFGIYFTDIDNGWTVGNSGTILSTTDGGTNWLSQTSGTSYVLRSVFFVDVNTGWAVGSSGTILKTTDGGTNWLSQSSGTPNTLYGINFANSYTGWAVGDFGTTLKHVFYYLPEPILSNPANNSTDISLNPTLIWQPVENAFSYTLQVSLTSNFEELIVNESEIEGTEFQLINNLEYYSQYFWRVRANGGNGEIGTWSEIWNFTTQPYIPWQVTETNNSSSIIVPILINPMIGERPISYPDLIGLFYQNDENEWTCAGYGIWNGTNLGITVWGDNPNTEIKDGFAVGETYTFKVWDAVLGQEWNATATYQTGESFYTVDGISFLASLTVNIPTEQNISLASGWSIISSYIQPENSAITSIFENIVSNVKILKNSYGQMYIPAFNINTIENWFYEDAYLLFMLNNNELTITGTKLLPEETPINLINGWNLSAYLRDNDIAPTTALASISPSLVLAKDNAGGIFSPAFGINTIGNMQSGQGYYFYMNEAAALTYPANSTQKAVAGDEITPLAKFNIPSMKNTGKNATLLISIESNDGNEIGVYNMNDELIGSGAVHNGIAAITIWGDDEATTYIDGAKDNEYLNVKLYNTTNNTSKEISLSQIKEITGNSEQSELYYITNAIYVAKASANYEAGFAMSIKNIPNPVESNVVFEFSLTDEANAEIQIYTSTGELVASIENGNYSAGLHRINFDASNLSSGMYNIVLSSGSKKVSSFMIVGK